jgi:hypothetical protein
MVKWLFKKHEDYMQCPGNYSKFVCTLRNINTCPYKLNYDKTSQTINLFYYFELHVSA